MKGESRADAVGLAGASREEALDRVCEQLVAVAAPLRFALARSEAEREAAFRLRYRCVVEQGWARPADFPDGSERDGWDDEAVHICSWDHGNLAGTVRLILPRPGRRLPTEEAFDLHLELAGETIDGGRLVIDSDRRGDAQHVILVGLLASCWLEGRKRGFRRFASVAPERLARLYAELGLDLEVLGRPRLHWGEERCPILITGADPVMLEEQRLSGTV